MLGHRPRLGVGKVDQPAEADLASFAVRIFIRFPVPLLVSCDEYGRICNS